VGRKGLADGDRQRQTVLLARGRGARATEDPVLVVEDGLWLAAALGVLVLVLPLWLVWL
jgi:hypothetical protein